MTKNREYKFTNSLINQTSPYLLQHAHNPVDWFPWCDQAFEKAKDENKLVLVSIGYSACHWCHVMENESFENEELAILMNSNFVCIKVDREERPDIDQVYMNALQLMTGQGGWPLNCFVLPNGKPIYGGTYFAPAKWQNVLLSLVEMKKVQPQKMEEYAEKLTQGIIQSDLLLLDGDNEINGLEAIKKSLENWKPNFDSIHGGTKRAPKFPLPSNYLFLMRYAYLMHDSAVLNHVYLTLEKMAKGGVFDHVGGGFSRYSTDTQWKVPHFEKMLYDNAQLVSLYAEAFQLTGNSLYKEIVYKTVAFVERELMSPQGAFYTALDADSQGQEGKFYVWEKEELISILADDFAFAADFYNINETGYWEDEQYILLRNKSDYEIALNWGYTPEELQNKVEKINESLFKIRSQRPRPGLDDKILTSWNGLMLSALLDAYVVFDDDYYLKLAKINAEYLLSQLKQNDNSLLHCHKNGNSSITGFAEDYACVIESFIKFYENTFDEKWIYEAKKLADYVFENFYDSKSGFFFFTSKKEKPLIARKMEVSDNVMPSSNSSLAYSFFKLSRYFDRGDFENISKKMLLKIIPNFIDYGSGYSNWGNLMLCFYLPFSEVVVCGPDALTNRRALSLEYLPNILYAGSDKLSSLPIIQNRFVDDKNLIFVCIDKTCKFPYTEVKDVVKQIKNR